MAIEQRCPLAMVWLTWLGLPLLALLVATRAGAVTGLFVLAVSIVAQIFYIRWFGYLSRWLGYGSVVDTPATSVSEAVQPALVTLYTANVCPFCPIIRGRLQALRRDGAFELREIDVTFRPEVVREKGLRSVPVVEVNGQLLVGNATSAELAAFLKNAARINDSPVQHA